MTPEMPKVEVPMFTVRCPQCGERFTSATNTDNLCMLCEWREYDDDEPIE